MIPEPRYPTMKPARREALQFFAARPNGTWLMDKGRPSDRIVKHMRSDGEIARDDVRGWMLTDTGRGNLERATG